MSICGQVVEEGGGRCVNVHTYVYLYIHTHTHIIVRPMILRLLTHKILENTFFLSVAPAFVYLLERGQHEHSCIEAHQKHLKVCLTKNLKVCPLDR